MKFRNGFWLLKDDVKFSGHICYVEKEVAEDSLFLYTSAKPVEKKGDTLNTTVLTTVLTPWKKDIIKVDVFHNMGAVSQRPEFISHRDIVDFDLGKTFVSSGGLKAKFQDDTIEFYYKNIKLTSRKSSISGYFRKSGNPFVAEYLECGIDEKFFGLGERFTPFVKNGQVVDIWNEDGGTCSEQAYKNIPFIISSSGYGILVGSYGKVSFEVQSEVADALQFSVSGEHLCYYIIGGEALYDVLYNYASLTGFPSMPPSWSYGLWLSTSFTTDYSEKTIFSFLDRMEKEQIPISVFHFDCFWMKRYEWVSFEWNPETFPDPEGMIKKLHDRGLKVCVWINPYIGQKSPLFKEAMDNGFLLKCKNGDIYQSDMWQSGMGIVDFTNPSAASWYKDKLRKLIRQGVDSFKTDFGERIPTNVDWFDSSNPSLMHNYYSRIYNSIVFDLLKEEKGASEAIVFARSATIGGQQFPVHWGGDCRASYSSMAETLRGGLSLSLSGFSFWSHDIGGFENKATPDLFKRWIAFGLFSTHSRLHGSSSYRVPWNFDQESCDVLSFFIKIKLSLIPYIISNAHIANTRGIPVLRPMLLEYGNDRNAISLDSQYMFGHSLLVAPIMNEKGIGSIYLPKGIWTSFWDYSEVVGPLWYEATYNYFSLPVFVKENSIVVRSISDYGNIAYLYRITDAFSDGISAKYDCKSVLIEVSDKSIKYVRLINVFIQGVFHEEFTTEVNLGKTKIEDVVFIEH